MLSRGGFSSKRHGCRIPFVAGFTGKPRIQRPGEFADTTTSIDTEYCDWNLYQQANGDEVRLSRLASKCLADDDLAGSQLSTGTPTSLPQDQVLINLLSFYPSFPTLQTQHAARGYNKVTISVLRESQMDIPVEEICVACEAEQRVQSETEHV